jgi:hypothetical protein
VTVNLARERRLGLVAGAAGLATAVLTLAAVTISAAGATAASRTKVGDARTLLLSIGGDESRQLLSAAMRASGAVLLAAVALYLFGVIRARDAKHSRLIPALGVVAFALLAGTALVSYLEVRDVAREFVASGPRTAPRADALLQAAREHSVLRATNVLAVVAAVAFGIWLSLTSWEAMRVGILSRFLGMFGIAAGVTSVVGIPEMAASLFLGWLVSVSVLALGWWPGGRPRAWDEGRAVSWA